MNHSNLPQVHRLFYINLNQSIRHSPYFFVCLGSADCIREDLRAGVRVSCLDSPRPAFPGIWAGVSPPCIREDLRGSTGTLSGNVCVLWGAGVVGSVLDWPRSAALNVLAGVSPTGVSLAASFDFSTLDSTFFFFFYGGPAPVGDRTRHQYYCT